MITITCPKCGTENSGDATNCKQCRINLKFALEHPEEIERIRNLPTPGLSEHIRQKAEEIRREVEEMHDIIVPHLEKDETILEYTIGVVSPELILHAVTAFVSLPVWIDSGDSVTLPEKSYLIALTTRRLIIAEKVPSIVPKGGEHESVFIHIRKVECIPLSQVKNVEFKRDPVRETLTIHLYSMKSGKAPPAPKVFRFGGGTHWFHRAETIVSLIDFMGI